MNRTFGPFRSHMEAAQESHALRFDGMRYADFSRHVMNVEAEVSLYPLTDAHLEHPVRDLAEALKQHGCEVEVGPMSLIVKGESSPLFESLRVGYEEAAKKSPCLLIVKACNVCPL